MSKVPAGHPGDEQLLRYADGELPEREAAKVRLHLEACWQCRSELVEFEKVVGACVHYRNTVLRTCLPSPPAAWCDIYEKFAEANASARERSFIARFLTAFGAFTIDAFTTPRRWIPAAGVILLLAGAFLWFEKTPTVQAAELLRQAVAAEQPSAAPRKVRIRTRRHEVVKLVAAVHVAPSTADEAEIKGLFDAARYNWDDPLSARSFQAWRDQLPLKSDRVLAVNYRDRSCYQIRTTTDSSEVGAATLTLAQDTLRPLESTIEFRNQEQISVSEVAPEPAPAPETAIAQRSASNDPVLHTPDLQGPQTSRAVTPGEELQVFAALHRLGADLGDPVEVSRTAERIVVSGVGVDPQRQQQIETALEPMPDVVVKFSEPKVHEPIPAEPGVQTPSVPSDLAGLQARIETQQGGRAAYDRFAAAVLDGYDAAMARLYALRRLAQRFPQDVEAQLAPGERDILRNLRREHADAFAAGIRQVQRTMTPALDALGAPAPHVPVPSNATGSWQPATEDLFSLARRVEINLGGLLGSASAAVSASELPTRLAADLAHLRACAEAYQTGSHGR